VEILEVAEIISDSSSPEFGSAAKKTQAGTGLVIESFKSPLPRFGKPAKLLSATKIASMQPLSKRGEILNQDIQRKYPDPTMASYMIALKNMLYNIGYVFSNESKHDIFATMENIYKFLVGLEGPNNMVEFYVGTRRYLSDIPTHFMDGVDKMGFECESAIKCKKGEKQDNVEIWKILRNQDDAIIFKVTTELNGRIKVRLVFPFYIISYVSLCRCRYRRTIRDSLLRSRRVKA